MNRVYNFYDKPFPLLMSIRLLHIDASINGEASVSRNITGHVVARLCDSSSELQTTYRDLASHPLSHFDRTNIAGSLAARPHVPIALDDPDETLDIFLASDIVVIGARRTRR